MPQPTLQEMMQANARLAVQAHPEFDYSESSLARLDQILDSIHNQLPGRLTKLFKKGLTDEQINSGCNLYGAYLGEVIVRHLQGEWALSSSYDNEPAVKMSGRVQNVESYPFDKVYKRIMNGAMTKSQIISE